MVLFCIIIEVKRVINIENLAGLTKSLHPTSKEFVIHVKMEYDYRLRSEQYLLVFLSKIFVYRRDKIMNVIKMAYTSKLKQNLPIYAIKNKELREFTTTEKDRDKGISRIPLSLARIYEEDILEDEDEISVEPLEILENYSSNMEHR